MREKMGISGRVTITVMDEQGNVKRRKPGFLRRLLRLDGKPMKQTHHNIITRQGDALIADALMAIPARPKITKETGYIQVGTGWTGKDTKNNTVCNKPLYMIFQKLDDGFPALKETWGKSGDTTIVYRTTYTVGSIGANGINEACLKNGNKDDSDCLAYAELTPPVNVTREDTLQVVWEITMEGD